MSQESGNGLERTPSATLNTSWIKPWSLRAKPVVPASREEPPALGGHRH